jgi:anti-sigma factor RsiW
MKSCSKYRKRIAWLALGALDSREERELQAHLPTCIGCRNYLEEMSTVTKKLSGRRISPEICASESFQQKLARRVKAQEAGHRWAMPGSKWKIALPVSGAAAAMVIALLIVVRPPGSSPSRSPITSVTTRLPSKGELPPTISNYRMVANRSLEKLDELLRSEANRNPPPAPVYTASSLSRTTISD